MSVTKDELDHFHRFALQKISNGGAINSMQQLVDEWRTEKERSEVNDAIRDGLADIEAGRYRSFDEFMNEFRKKHNFSRDA